MATKKKTVPSKKKTVSRGRAVAAGALIGAAAGIGAGILATSKTGKKLARNAKTTASDFYKYLEPRLRKAKKMTAAELQKVMKTAAVRYSQDKKLTTAEGERLLKEAKASWTRIKKNL